MDWLAIESLSMKNIYECANEMVLFAKIFKDLREETIALRIIGDKLTFLISLPIVE